MNKVGGLLWKSRNSSRGMNLYEYALMLQDWHVGIWGENSREDVDGK
jgi:hypothetical protein